MGIDLSQSQKSKGQYFTPSNIVETIVTLTLDYVDKKSLPFRVLDPATGEGIFTQEVVKLYRKHYAQIHVSALDIDPIVLKEAISRLSSLVSSDIKIEFFEKNFLTESFQIQKDRTHGLTHHIILWQKHLDSWFTVLRK